jgi:hypothetical protein
MKAFFLALSLCTVNALHAQPVWQAPPRLVVGIVVDQMRTDMLYREWDNFGTDGFRRLVREGSFQRDAHYGYVPTFTAPGHASIYTGTTPARHGITANYIYSPALRRTVYCAKDSAVRGVGTDDPSAQRSPVNLLASTLADEMELRWGGKARTVAVSLKDRSAIMPMGRGGDAAYWYLGGEGKFVSSTWYLPQLPAWLQAFNAEERPAKYLRNTWDTALPRNRYHSPVPDDNPYEWPLSPELPPTLPVDLAALGRAGASLDLIKHTPWGNTLTTDVALAALAGEHLGEDSIPDLLAVSFSAPDESAHDGGQRSLELEDIYIRLDRELARLLEQLDQRVGKGQWTAFLTADHGGADVPAYLQDLRASAGYVTTSELLGHLRKEGFGAVLDTIVKEQLYLRPNTSDAIADSVARALCRHQKVAAAASAHRLREGAVANALERAMARGLMPGRSGDVLFALQPGYLIQRQGEPHQGTEHGTAWNYDTAVPVLFLGRGIRQGEVLRRTDICDIASTVCALLGMTLPNAAEGQVVTEALAPAAVGR